MNAPFTNMQEIHPRSKIQWKTADDRELVSALLTDMRELLYVFGDSQETAALAALLFRGNERILAKDDIPLFLEALEALGVDDAWEIFSIFGSFRHIDMPIIPNLRLDLNAISQSDCRADFRFTQDTTTMAAPSDSPAYRAVE